MNVHFLFLFVKSCNITGIIGTKQISFSFLVKFLYFHRKNATFKAIKTYFSHWIFQLSYTFLSLLISFWQISLFSILFGNQLAFYVLNWNIWSIITTFNLIFNIRFLWINWSKKWIFLSHFLIKSLYFPLFSCLIAKSFF